jgi:hypothetical protein
MEPRFGHDFSQVRVHTDEQAVDSARAMNALAYMVGRDAVFGTGQYVPITTMKKGLQFPSTSTQPDIHSSVTVIGGRDAMRTGCDVIADPRDRLSVHEGGRFRTVGEGKPKPEVLIPDLKDKTPCLFEAGMVHEQQHVQNSLKDCSDFKKCVDQRSSKYLRFGEPKISFEDFGECYSKHNGGNMKDCIQNERLAYNAGIKKAKELIADPKCSKEKDTLKENITFWEKIKDHAPNCDKKTEK